MQEPVRAPHPRVQRVERRVQRNLDALHEAPPRVVQRVVRFVFQKFRRDERHSVARLIGAPPGYVGYEEGGYLTETVRRRPYCVILLDEIEKAHSDVFNILLQVLDDGRLTDGQGRTVDFRNAVIVMTSNLGSQLIQDLGNSEDYEGIKAAVMETVRQHFRPEFLNRIDEAVVFHALDRLQIRDIARIQAQNLVDRLAERQIGITLEDSALDLLAEAGFDPVYGARPLKRALQTQVENPLARQLLDGAFVPGDHISVQARDGAIVFERVLEAEVVDSE